MPLACAPSKTRRRGELRSLVLWIGVRRGSEVGIESWPLLFAHVLGIRRRRRHRRRRGIVFDLRLHDWGRHWSGFWLVRWLVLRLGFGLVGQRRQLRRIARVILVDRLGLDRRFQLPSLGYRIVVSVLLARRESLRGPASGTRLNALASAGENGFSVGRRSARGRLRRLALQRAYGSFKGHPEGAQHARCGALAVTDDGRQYDGAVDFASPSAAGGGCRRFEDAPHVGSDGEFAMLPRRARWKRGKVAFDLVDQFADVDVAGRQDEGRIGIIAECQQHMLECDLDMPPRSRMVGRPRQRRREAG